MKKHFLTFFLLLMVGILIIPSISLAAWWNPFTWKIFNRAPKANTERIIVATSTPQNILPIQGVIKLNEKKKSQPKTNDQSSEIEKNKIEAEQKAQAALKRAQEEVAITKLKEELEQQNKRIEKIRTLYLEWADTLLAENNNVKNAWSKLKSSASNNLISVSGVDSSPAIAIRKLLEIYIKISDKMIPFEDSRAKEIENVKDITLKATHFNDYQKYEEFFKLIADNITASAGRYDQVVKEYNSDMGLIINSSNSYSDLPANVNSYYMPRQTMKTCQFSISGSVIKDYYSGSVECFPF